MTKLIGAELVDCELAKRAAIVDKPAMQSVALYLAKMHGADVLGVNSSPFASLSLLDSNS